jgi:hypothetical protein
LPESIFFTTMGQGSGQFFFCFDKARNGYS